MIESPSWEVGWYNLGYWPGTKNYPMAARNLALLVGEKALLCSNDHVLDIGVGFGQQVPLWQQMFQVSHVTAFEPKVTSWQRASSYASGTAAIMCQKFEDWRPATVHPINKINKVVCVDAVYHIPYDRFWSALSRLPHLDTVAVTDLYLLRSPKGGFEACCLSAIALITSIPRKNFRTQARYQEDLTSLGTCEWRDISQEVIDGFCQYVKEAPTRHLSLRHRLKPMITSLIFRWLRRRRLIGYALVSLQIKPQDTDL